MDYIIIKTINCKIKDDPELSEIEIKDNYYKIPNSVLANLGYNKITAEPLDGCEFHSTQTKKDIYNGWVVFNDNTKIHLNSYELYNYDRWGDRTDTKYEFTISTSFKSSSISRAWSKPTLDNFNIKYVIFQAHPDRKKPLPPPELLTDEELNIFSPTTDPDPEPDPQPDPEPDPQPDPEPEPEPDPEPNIINATIDGLTNIEEAIKDKEEITVIANDGYYFNKTNSTGWLTVLGKDCYLKNGTIRLRDIDSMYTGTISVEFKNNSDKQATKIEISSPISLDSLISGGYIEAVKIPEPEIPKEPEYPTDYPTENLQNVYIDEYRIYKKSIGGGEVKTIKEIVKFDTIKEWLDGGIAESIYGTKGDIFIIAENGYNFSLSNEDGYIIDHTGQKLYFYEMYQQADNIPDEIFVDTRNQTYKNAKIFKGGTQTQPLEIIFYKYSKYELSMYLIGFFEMETKNLGQPNLPPFGKILKSKITEISINAPVVTPKYVTNLAYDTYIIDDEQLSKLRDNGDLYNDLMINTYNYPLKFEDNDLIETQFKIDSANFNANCKKFTSISTEIPIFEFDIPTVKGVESVEIYPIYSNKILIDYTLIQGKHIKGVSVYDCITNTNVLKILADNVLIDYFDYNIQSEVPINYNINKVQSNGNISRRIPLFKSFIIMKTTEYMLLDPKKQNYYKGEITKLNSQILKKEFEMLENLFKTGIFINEEEKLNDK